MNAFNKINAAFDKLLDYTVICAGVLIAYQMLTVCYEVIVRSLGHPTMWVQETIEVSLLYITFLAMAAVARKGTHAKMDFLVKKLSPIIQSYFGIIYSILTLIVSLVFFWYGSRVVWSCFERGLTESSLLELPIGPILIVIPIGGLLMVIQFIRQTYLETMKLKSIKEIDIPK